MTNLEINRNIADFIGGYCAQWNLSASKFAEKCDVPYMTIKRILACNVQKIDVCTVIRIAQATRSSIMEILKIENEYPGRYRRFTCAASRDRDVILSVMDVLEKLHLSGNECREIPYMDLAYDRASFLIDASLFRSDGLDTEKMEKITFRSSFSQGMSYYGFRLPNYSLHPYFLKGNTLLVINAEPQDGEIGAYAWKDQGYVRLIFRRVKENGHLIELLPINNLGRKYTIDKDNITDMLNWVRIGVVVGVVR